jgi:DNA-directed RNA polymerase specialized sigma24 family protein
MTQTAPAAPPGDATLVGRVRDGDVRAYRLASKMVADQAESEDVVQAALTPPAPLRFPV